MSCFPDTSFLCALYRNQLNSPMADCYVERMGGVLGFSNLVLLEFRQSIRLQIYLHEKDHSKGFARLQGEQMLRNLQADLSSGVSRVVPVEWPEVHQLVEVLSSKYTASSGHRLVDILHVASALHLGVEEFLTFDANQKKLAEAEGLGVPV